MFSYLRIGEKTDNYPTELASVFNKDIQSFMMNWMQYNPQEEIKKLKKIKNRMFLMMINIIFAKLKNYYHFPKTIKNEI